MTQERAKTTHHTAFSDLEAEIVGLFVQISKIMGHPCKVYNTLSVAAPVLYIGPRPSHLSEMLDGLGHEYRCASARHGEVELIVKQILPARNEAQQSSRQRSPLIHPLFAKESILPKLITELESV
jgi:hypothetical protein